ncbi:MAG TPA: hypothetical protein VGI40_23580 [Pirellulaceae bacterium]|jgi:hypothetical protein
MSSPFIDPVVAEIHAHRQELLDAAGGDVRVLMQQAAERQNRSNHLIIREPLSAQAEQQKVSSTSI